MELLMTPCKYKPSKEHESISKYIIIYIKIIYCFKRNEKSKSN